MLTDMFRTAGLTWHCVLSGELVHAYKPDPAVYRLALDRLALDPRRTLTPTPRNRLASLPSTSDRLARPDDHP